MDKGFRGPPNPSRLANGQGFRPPPHPSRLANGQGLRAPQPFMTWGRPPNGQGFGAPPQPFTTCKWTRVGGPATLHDLGAASKWTRVGADFQMDKGWGPPTPICKWTRVGAQPFTTPPQPCTTCRWTRFGGPTLHDLRMDKGWGPPNPSRLANLKFCLDKHWGLQTIERLSIFLRGPGASPQIETSMTSPSSQNVR